MLRVVQMKRHNHTQVNLSLDPAGNISGISAPQQVLDRETGWCGFWFCFPKFQTWNLKIPSLSLQKKHQLMDIGQNLFLPLIQVKVYNFFLI